MLPKTSFAAVALLAPLGPDVPPQEPGGEGMERRIEEVVSSEMLDEGASAVALWIDLGGDTLLERGWGAPLRNGDEDFGPYAAVPANGLAEVLIGAALLARIDGGDLEPDDLLTDLLEGVARENGMPSVGHVACHSTGFPAYRPDPEAEDPAAAFRAFLSETGLESDVGTCFEYANTNLIAQRYVLLASGVRDVTAFLRSDVVASIGLEATRFAEDGEDDDEATGRIGVVGKDWQPEFALAHLGLPAIESTAADVGTLVRALHAGGWLGSRASRAVGSPPPLEHGSVAPYAYGMWRSALGAVTGFGVTVGSGDWTLHAAHYPGYDMTIALCVDAQDLQMAGIERSIARIVLDQPGPTVEDRVVLEEELERYVGTYQVGCNTYEIHISDERLTLRSEDYDGDRLMYQGGNLFVLESDWEVRLLFQVEDGVAVAFELDVHGVSSVATRIDQG